MYLRAHRPWLSTKFYLRRGNVFYLRAVHLYAFRVEVTPVLTVQIEMFGRGSTHRTKCNGSHEFSFQARSDRNASSRREFVPQAFTFHMISINVMSPRSFVRKGWRSTTKCICVVMLTALWNSTCDLQTLSHFCDVTIEVPGGLF